MESILAELKFTKALHEVGIELVSPERELIAILILTNQRLRQQVGPLSYSFPMLTLKKAYKIAQEVDFKTIDAETKEVLLAFDEEASHATLKEIFEVLSEPSGTIGPIYNLPYYCIDLIADMYEDDFDFLWNMQSSLLLMDEPKTDVDWTVLKLQPSHRFFSAPALDKVADKKSLNHAVRNSKTNSLPAVVAFYECVKQFDNSGIVLHPEGPLPVTETQARLLTMGLIESDLAEYKSTGYIPLGAPVSMNQNDYYSAKNYYQALKDIIYNASDIVAAQIQGRILITYAAPLLLSLFPESKYKVSLRVTFQYSWLRALSAANRYRPATVELKYALGHAPAPAPKAEKKKETNDLKVDVTLDSAQEAMALEHMKAIREVYNRTLDANAAYFEENKRRSKIICHTKVITEVRKEYPNVKRPVLLRAHNLAKIVYEESGHKKKPPHWPATRNEMYIKKAQVHAADRMEIEPLGNIQTLTYVREAEVKYAVLKFKNSQFQLQIKYKNV